MKVGFFTYGMDRELTGIGRYTVELTRALSKLDSAVDITLLNPYPESVLPWYREFEVFPVPQLKLMPAAASLGNLVLHRAAKTLQLDILHDPCGIAPFLLTKQRYKRVTTVHDAIPFIHPETQPLLTRWVFNSLVRATRFTADAVITVSQSAANDLRKHTRIPSSKLHVTHLGRPLLPFVGDQLRQEICARTGISAPFFLYVGALHPRKNISRVLQAFANVASANPEAQLVIVGPPSWGASSVLSEVLSRSERDKQVIFTGYVTDEELHILYADALSLVFPSLYEGFGLPALEAMTHGTPVIGSNVSSLPEVIGETGLLVDPTSVEEIAAAMQRLLDDPTLVRQLGKAAQARSTGFTWENTAERTLSIYQQIT